MKEPGETKGRLVANGTRLRRHAVNELLFLPNSDVLAAATQYRVQGALQRWLADIAEIESVVGAADAERLVVSVVYTRLETGERESARFVGPARVL